MNCGEARSVLWPPERPRILDGAVVEARAHVRTCPECLEYLAQDRAVLDTCHRLRTVRAPLPVRQRVFEALARGRSGERGTTTSDRSVAARASGFPRWSVRSAGGVAAVGLLAAVVLFGTLSLERETARSAVAADPAVAVSSSEAAFVEDYLRRAVGEDFLETSDPEEIARFLRRELGLHSGPLRLAGLVPTRVEICLLDGKRGAMVVYRWDGRQVTHYLVPNESEPHEPSLAPHHAGLTVVTWSSGKIEEAIVAEADPETLLDLLRTPGD